MREMRIYFPDEGMTYGLLVTPLGDDHYRLEESSIFVDIARYGDTLHVVREANGRYLLRAVVPTSQFQTHTIVLSKQVTEATDFQLFVKQLEDEGGNWEIRFGGFVTLNLPQSSSYDLEAALATLKQLDQP